MSTYCRQPIVFSSPIMFSFYETLYVSSFKPELISIIELPTKSVIVISQNSIYVTTDNHQQYVNLWYIVCLEVLVAALGCFSWLLSLFGWMVWFSKRIELNGLKLIRYQRNATNHSRKLGVTVFHCLPQIIAERDTQTETIKLLCCCGSII